MENSTMHPHSLKEVLPDSVYQAYSNRYEKISSLYRSHGAIDMSIAAKAKLAHWTAMACGFSHLMK